MPHVLFDEAHSEAWTIRPELARELQPSHPADSSYADAADTLRARDFTVAANTAHLDADALAAADVLVIAHPADAKFERVVGGGARSPVFGEDEIDAIVAWVAAGGGLIVLGEEEQEKYATNLNALVSRFGIEVAHDAVQDYDHHVQAPSWIEAQLDGGVRDGVDLLARVDDAVFYRSGTLALSNGARVLARTSPSASTPSAPLLAVTTHGLGRVVVAADSDLFGDDCIGAHGHRALWTNLVYWAAGHAFASAHGAEGSGVEHENAWMLLRDATESLRALQTPAGELAADASREEAARLVDVMVSGIEALAPRFPHQAEHLKLTVRDLRAWADGGFGVPDFGASLDAFRPDLVRQDGIEHLVVFPMYKQNGSRDKVFEALLVRVPWPEWLAELESRWYDNAKFVPVTLTDNTSGYDSECAVLFPETVTTAGPMPNHFGGIFCDRESERFRRVVGAAASTLRLNLPPDAAALLASEPLSRDAFELWDLVHDRAHSHGDLPFDPFMIKQRMPFWMYSLEELRCDLTAFGEAVRLEREEGFAFARHSQYAILFDRLFRFPITGPRVRNYDGLGGQLLFAYLHKTGRLHWTDNQLTIEWDHVADGVLELRERVEELYRAGIDRTKLQHWAAAHDLIAEYVSPAVASKWVRGVREYVDVDDPRPYIDEVLPDEFPLSIFYTSLQRKLEDAVTPAPVAAA